MSDGKQRLTVGIAAHNDNPEIDLIDHKRVAGSDKIFNKLNDDSDRLNSLVYLHPNLMHQGMKATVLQHTRNGEQFRETVFRLITKPENNQTPLITDDINDPLYYLNFWEIKETFEFTDTTLVRQYSGDINGLKPTFPHDPANESFWHDEPLPTDKWYRERTSNELLPNGLYNWSIIFSISGEFQTGDYVATLYLRNDVKPPTPPTLIDGVYNNDPVGWTDGIPNGTARLWQIINNKDRYGQIKQDWIGPIEQIENENLVRYSVSSIPNPNTLVNTSSSAADGTQGDTDLNNAGWIKTPNDTHIYKAEREDLGSGNYTSWQLQKIVGESGEFTDNIFKLFDRNLDFDAPSFISSNTPNIDNPVEGTVSPNNDWSGEPIANTDSKICYISTAKKFNDGSLKTPWSPPIPFFGEDAFRDYISSQGQNSFKYANRTDAQNNANPVPSSIDLTFNLYRGINELTTNITYKWYKVFNNGTANEPTLDGDGRPTSTPIATTRVLTVTAADVATKAVFRCYALYEFSPGNDIQFVEDETIVDISDGDDARRLVISAESQLVIYNVNNTDFNISNIRIRYYQNFLDSETFYWFRWNGSSWLEIINGGIWSISGNLLTTLPSNLFAADTSSEEETFMVSTDQANPQSATAFYDVVTIGKTGVANGSAQDGNDGTDSSIALLSNEVQGIVLNTGTGLPQTGELAKAFTVVSVYLGNVLQNANSDYTISLSDTTNFEFVRSDADGTTNVSGNYYKVRVQDPSGWAANVLSRTCDIIITFGSITLIKTFTVITSYDAPGIIIADIDINSTSTNQTFSFTPNDRTDILLRFILNENQVEINPSAFGGNVVWSINGNTTLPSITDRYPSIGTNRNIIRIKRSDCSGNAIKVAAQLTYNSRVYKSVGVTIDDVLAAQPYRLFYRHNPVPSEPIPVPTKPADAAWNSFSQNGTAQGWYKDYQDDTYFFVDGYELANGNITFGNVIRFRGEQGANGSTSDFIENLYAYDNQALPGSGTNSTINQMLGAQWRRIGNEGTGAILYRAYAQFNGTDLGNGNATPSVGWRVIRETPQAPIDGDDGDDGVDGRDPEFQRNGDNLEWRYANQSPAASWIDLGNIKGDTGDDANITATFGNTTMGAQYTQFASSGPQERSLSPIITKPSTETWYVLITATVNIRKNSSPTRVRVELLDDAGIFSTNYIEVDNVMTPITISATRLYGSGITSRSIKVRVTGVSGASFYYRSGFPVNGTILAFKVG